MVKKEVPSSIILSWTSFFFRQSSRVEVVGVKVVVVVYYKCYVWKCNCDFSLHIYKWNLSRFFMAVHTCRVPWNYIHWSGYWCKGSTCTIKTMHNKLKKKWQNPLFQSSFTLFFLYIPKGARTITWPFCLPSTGKIQVQHPAGTRRTIKTTFSNRKRSQTIAQFILIAKGLQAIYLFRF